MKTQILKVDNGMNTNELVIRCTGACLFNFGQLQKTDEVELVKYVSSEQVFYRGSSCESKLNPGQVEKNSVDIIHSVEG